MNSIKQQQQKSRTGGGKGGDDSKEGLDRMRGVALMTLVVLVVSKLLLLGNGVVGIDVCDDTCIAGGRGGTCDVVARRWWWLWFGSTGAGSGGIRSVGSDMVVVMVVSFCGGSGGCDSGCGGGMEVEVDVLIVAVRAIVAWWW